MSLSRAVAAIAGTLTGPVSQSERGMPKTGKHTQIAGLLDSAKFLMKMLATLYLPEM
jgi:hypothetical protein